MYGYVSLRLLRIENQRVAHDVALRADRAVLHLAQAAVARAAAVLADALRNDAALRVRSTVHHLRTGVLMLALRRERDRQNLAAGTRLHHVHGRVLHRQPAAQVAVDPLHERIAVGDGPLGDQVVDVVGPVLNRRVPAASTAADDDLHHRRMQALARVHRGRAAFDVMHLGAFIDDDERPLELPHLLGIDAEIRLQRKLDLHALRHVDERSARPHGRVQRRELVVFRRNDRAEVFAQQIADARATPYRYR